MADGLPRRREEAELRERAEPVGDQHRVRRLGRDQRVERGARGLAEAVDDGDVAARLVDRGTGVLDRVAHRHVGVAEHQLVGSLGVAGLDQLLERVAAADQGDVADRARRIRRLVDALDHPGDRLGAAVLLDQLAEVGVEAVPDLEVVVVGELRVGDDLALAEGVFEPVGQVLRRGFDEACVVVALRHQLGGATHGRGDEGDPLLQRLVDGHRGVLDEGRHHRDQVALGEERQRLGLVLVGDRDDRALPGLGLLGEVVLGRHAALRGQLAAPLAEEGDGVRDLAALVEQVDRVAEDLDALARLEPAEEHQVPALDHVAVLARRAGAGVDDRDVGEVDDVGLHEDIGLGQPVADPVHERQQVGRPADHHIGELDALLLGVRRSDQVGVRDREHLVVPVPDVRRRRLDQEERVAERQPESLGHQRVDQAAAPLGGVDDVERLLVAQPLVGAGVTTLPVRGGAPQGHLRDVEVVQRHAELGVPLDPELRRLVLDDRALEEEHVHLVALGGEPLGQVVVRRRDAAVAYRADDLLGHDGDPESARRCAQPHGFDSGEAHYLEVVALHLSPGTNQAKSQP